VNTDASTLNPLNADLHCHSKVSDGTLEPEALAEEVCAIASMESLAEVAPGCSAVRV